VAGIGSGAGLERVCQVRHSWPPDARTEIRDELRGSFAAQSAVALVIDGVVGGDEAGRCPSLGPHQSTEVVRRTAPGGGVAGEATTVKSAELVARIGT
jgi:hypothetical protein